MKGTPQSREEESADRNIRVLVVEDDPDMLASIRECLELRGFSVDTASDGIGAMNLVSEREYDILVSDIRLPGLSGTEVARNVLKRRLCARVILLTAYPDPQTVKDTYLAGAVHFLSKPVSLRQLAWTVEVTALESKLGLTSRDSRAKTASDDG